MVRDAVALEEGFVGGVLDQRVLEQVARARAIAGGKDELRPLEPLKPGGECVRVAWPHGIQHLAAEFAPEHRRELRDGLCLSQAVESREQRIVQARGNHHLRHGGADGGVTRLDDRLGEFFDIEGHAVGLLDDPAQYIRREIVSEECQPDQLGRFGVTQARKGNAGHVRLRRQRTVELGAVRQKYENFGVPNAFDQVHHQIQRGRICPMQIFQDEDAGARLCPVDQDRDEELAGEQTCPFRGERRR